VGLSGVRLDPTAVERYVVKELGLTEADQVAREALEQRGTARSAARLPSA
jgi:hypothetical protein